MPTANYTTSALVTTRMSAIGLSLRVDDAAGRTAQCIADASDKVEFYLLNQYTSAALATSNWVTKVTTDITVMYLCEGRLNAASKSAVRAYEDAIADLERCEAGKPIPGLPTRKEAVPTVRNYRVHLHPTGPSVVVSKSRSTGTPEGYAQRTDPLDGG